MQLSRFFTLAELTRSDTAAREGIPNQPAAGQVEMLRTLCKAVLDPLREAVGRPIRVTSGFRGPALNARIGGSATSQHSHGQAADVQAPGLEMLELFKTVIRLGLPFDQLIYEAQSATVKWVHVSHRASGNRGEVRVAQFNAAGRPTGYPLVSIEQALAMQERTTRSGRAAADPGYVERADEPEFEAEPVAAAAPRPRARTGVVKAAAGPLAKPARKVATKSPAPAAAASKVAAKKAPVTRKATARAPAKAVAKKAVTAKPVPAKAAAAKAAPAKAAPARKAAARPAGAKKAVAKTATRSRTRQGGAKR